VIIKAWGYVLPKHLPVR